MNGFTITFHIGAFKTRIVSLALVSVLLTGALQGQVPQLVNYQGRVAVGAVNFDGSGLFKFALVNGIGTATYWSNDGTSAAGSQPAAAIALTVTKGLYSVLLGDTTIANMTAIPASVWGNADVRLRVWFNDGANGSQLLSPDQRLTPNGYLPDGAVTSAAIAGGAITSAKIAPGAVTSTQLAPGAIANGNLANSSITINAGSGLAGGGAVSLGGNVTLTNAGVLSLAGGGGITVNAATGAVTLSTNATSANTPGAIVLRDASGDFSARTITLSGNLALPATSATTGILTLGGSRLLHSFGVQNVFVGGSAGNFAMSGGSNTASGYESMLLNTTGSSNTASGWRALYFNTGGSHNTATGQSSLVNNMTGAENTATGSSSLASNTTGNSNTAIGVTALFGNTIGSSNSAIGYQALRVNTSGYWNTASGAFALGANGTGFENTASGVSALAANTTGNDNTASGKSALAANTTGSNNIALGAGAGSLLTTGSNNIAIGHPGIAGETGIIRIGTAQTDTFLSGVIHGNGAGLSVPASSITGTFTTTQIANGAVTSAKLATGLTLGGKLQVDGDWDGEQGALGLTGHRPTLRFTGDADTGNESWLLHLGGTGPGNLGFLHRSGPGAYNTVMAFPASGRKVEIYGGDALGLIGSQPFLTFFDSNAANSASRIQAAGGDLFLQSASYIAGQPDTGLVLKSGTGFVGIGTTAPVAKLHAETSLTNTAAVYGNATGTGGVGVYGQTTAGTAVFGQSTTGAAIHGRSTNGAAVYAEGNAVQSRESGGFAKAMAYIDPFLPADQYVVRCYNSRLAGNAASIAPGGIIVTRGALGSYYVDFGFDVSDRFISITPQANYIGNQPQVTGNIHGVVGGRIELTFRRGDTLEDTRFHIIIF